MKQLAQKHPLLTYFALAYLISWLIWLPMILLYLQNRPDPIPLAYLLPAVIGVYGPTIAAILTTALADGKVGLQALLAKYRLWKTAPGWYAFIFLLYPAIFLAGSLLYILFSGASPSLHLSHLFNLPLIFLLAIPFGPLGEELGWRGFALPRLQARLGTFSASLLLGVLWFGWHLPAAFVPGVALPAIPVTWEVLLNYLVMLVGFSMLFTFLYNQTGGSVLLSILLHAVINSTAQSINPLLWGKLPAGQLMPLLWCVAALLWGVIFCYYGSNRLNVGGEMNAIPKKHGGCLVWIFRLALGLILVFGLLLAAGYFYQTRTTASDFEQFPVPGQRVDVGGFSLHIRCTGTGSPTVVIDAGNGDFSLGWQGIQPEIAKSTRICAYDRAGYGWSDLSPNPRNAESFVTELHSLLVNAGEKPPYILVGQSLGGFTARMFASRYPAEVSGMVLVDAAHEQQLERFPPEYAQINQQQVSYLGAMQLMSRFGILRLIGNASGGADLAPPQVRKLPADVQPVYLAMMSHPSYFEASLAELRALPETSQQVRAARRPFDFPLIVLTAENTPDPEAMQAIGMPADFDVTKIQQTWRELQADLATLSPQGEHFIVEGSGHAIELDKPQAVIDAILEVLVLARKD